MVLYKQGEEKVVLRFNAANSTNINWFSEANVLESPWEDLLNTTKNYFTIEGPCFESGCRDFHINHAYGSCPNDFGWLSIGNHHGCDWESRFAFGVKLIYSKIATHTNYNNYSKFSLTICHGLVRLLMPDGTLPFQFHKESVIMYLIQVYILWVGR